MLSARNINDFRVLFDDYRLISDSAFEQENARTKVAPGDVLLTIVGTIGRTAVVTENNPPFALQRSVAVLRPCGISARYLAYALNSPEQQQWLINNAKGTAQKGIYLKTLGAAQIPFAPAAEQTRIVAKLEELLSDLDAGVVELKAAQKKLAQYRQSLLKAAVEGALTAEWRAQRSAPPLPNPAPARGEGLEPETGAILAPLPPRGGGAGGEGAHSSQLTTPTQQGHARALRSAQTPTEHALWQQLRAKRFGGFKFRRQQPLGRYIVDFVCFEQRLIVELDGGQHADQQNYDAARDAWLQAQGYRVLRFWNNAWHAQQDAVLDAVWCALHDEAPPLPNPSPAKGEGLEPETGAQLLARILTERRARWEAKQLARFQQQGKAPPKDWQTKYPEPVQPDTSGLPELPQGWVWASVEQLAELMSGNTPKNVEDKAAPDGVVPWFKVGDMNRAGNEVWLTTAQINFAHEVVLNFGMKIAPAGTIVFPKRGGAIATNKKRRLQSEACFDLNTMGLVPTKSSAEWLWWWFQGVDLGRLSDGSNVPQINNPDIAPLVVPVPPASEQDLIVDCLKTALQGVAEQENAVEFALKQSTAQRQNILRAAFAGQLVPQDPNDEPASVLLARIRAERAATPKPRGRKARERN